MALVETDYEDSSIDVGEAANTFISNSSASAALWRFDTERCKVLGMKIVTLVPKISGTHANVRDVNKNFKIKRSLTYNPKDGFLNGKNLYIVTWGWTANPLDAFNFNYDVRVYFKDP